MKRWKQLTLAVVATLGVLSVAVPVPDTQAIDVFEGCEQTNNGTTVCKDATAGNADNAAVNMTEIAINTLLMVLGMVAVVMIIIGGIRYATSGGDSGQVKSAKDTILYSVAGLVVAILAFAIVNFVLDSF